MNKQLSISDLFIEENEKKRIENTRDFLLCPKCNVKPVTFESRRGGLFIKCPICGFSCRSPFSKDAVEHWNNCLKIYVRKLYG